MGRPVSRKNASRIGTRPRLERGRRMADDGFQQEFEMMQRPNFLWMQRVKPFFRESDINEMMLSIL
jgi:hypothetical protein